jgi:hypothetical protein
MKIGQTIDACPVLCRGANDVTSVMGLEGLRPHTRAAMGTVGVKLMRYALIGFCGLWASTAWSQDQDAPGYVGVGVSSFSYEEVVLPDIYTFDESGSSWKLFGGYNWNENWGIELSWAQSSELEDTASAVDTDLGNVTATLGLEFSALSLRGMGYLPFSWGSLFAGIGFYDGEGDASLVVVSDALGTESVSDTTSESGATALLGVQWSFSNWNARVEYEWWDLDTADASSLGVSLAYRF